MIISDWSVRNRTTVFFLTFIIAICGVISYYALPRESSPDIPIPFVTISTTYRGGSPEDIEKLITIPIEDKLKGLTGVKEMKSISEDSQSIVSLEFETGINIDDVLPKVKDRVDLAKPDLPSDLEDDPVIQEMNFSDMPVLIIGLSGDFGEKQLGKIADDLKDDIEGINGVLEVDLAGKVDREIHVEIYPERLTQYNIPLSTLANIVGIENQNVSGGSIKLAQGRFQLRVPGEFATPEEANYLVVARNNGAPVYLRDLGEIKDGLKDRDTTSRVNGQPAISLSVKKRSGANIIEIVDKIKALLAERKHTLPKGLQITLQMDRGEEIRTNVRELEDNMLSGLLLVIVVVCVAMGLRNSIVVSLSIPLSMMMSFIVLRALGITLNMVVLFSLTLALGMLVDNAIVIVENIYRFMQQGVSRIEAAKRATSEVAWPIIGSSMTTIAAFFPLLWWDGIMGSFMVFIPKTVIVTLLCCLFVALVINPAMAAAVLKVRRKGKRVTADEVQSAGEHPMLEGGGAIVGLYRRVLKAALRNRLAVLAFAGGFVFLMIEFWMLQVGMKKPMELFPSPDPREVYVNLNMPQGCGLEYADSMVKEVARRLYAPDVVKDKIPYAQAIAPKEHRKKSSGEVYSSPSFLPNVDYTIEKASFKPGMSFFGSGSDNQVGLHMVDLPDRTASSAEVRERVRGLVEGIPGAEMSVEGEEQGPPTGKPINIEISGEDFKTLGNLAEQVKGYIKKVPFATNIRSDFESGSPTLEIRIDRQKAGFLGLNTQTVGYIIKSAFNGAKVSNYREGDEKYDILVRFDEQNRRLVDTLRQIMIPTTDFGQVPLTTIAEIRYTGGLGRITRIDDKRVVTVSADVDDTKTTGAVALQQAIDLLNGSSLITQTQVPSWPRLLTLLQEGLSGKASPAAQAVANGLNSRSRAVIERDAAAVLKDGKPSEEDQTAILDGLNERIRAADFSTDPAFQGLKLPAQAQGMLKAGKDLLPYLDAKDLQKLNREVLGAALEGTVGAADAEAFTPPSGYSYTFTGENEEMQKAMNFLGGALLVALLLILLVLVGQFNSVAYPVIILSSALLCLGGVFLGLGLHQLPFGIIMSGVGVISLAGVVVNNAIVLVDYTLQLMRRGLPLQDAIVAAGATRLRPVLLTATTTVLGLIPMALGWSFSFSDFTFSWESESSQWWRGMALPVIYGLTVATMLTLVVVPVIFSLIEGAREHVHHARRDLKRIHIFVGSLWIRLYDRLFGTERAEPWVQAQLREFAQLLEDEREEELRESGQVAPALATGQTPPAALGASTASASSDVPAPASATASAAAGATAERERLDGGAERG